MGWPIYKLKKRCLLASANGAFEFISVYLWYPVGSLALVSNGPIKAPGLLRRRRPDSALADSALAPLPLLPQMEFSPEKGGFALE